MHEGKDKIQQSNPKNKIHVCQTCFKEISDEPFALCIHCKGFIQCLQCLNVGIEKDKHLREHPFIIITPNQKSIFRTDWTCFDEIYFLDALEKYGLGNYEDIESVLGFKSTQEYESHYRSVYLGSLLCPKPEAEVQMSDAPAPLPKYPTSPIDSLPSDKTDIVIDKMNRKQQVSPGEEAGYMPKRKEFEDEYMNDFEELVCDMQFSDEEDTQESFDEKMERLVAYDSVINEREKRTNTAIDFNMHVSKYAIPSATIQSEREVTNTVIKLAPFIGAKEANEIIDLKKDRDRKRSLIELRTRWKMNGVRTIKEGNLFTKLDSIMRNGNLTLSDKNTWKSIIAQYNEPSDEDAVDKHLLLNKEESFCKDNGLQIQMYLVLKDLVIREFSIRGQLSREECIELDPSHKDELDQMYDLFVSVGWICE